MTLDITNPIFRVYEEYVIQDKNLEEGAKGLISTSNDYRYLKCMDMLTKKGLNLSKEELEYVKKYIESDKTRKGEKLAFRFCMLEYDAAKTKEEKDKVLERFTKDVIHLSFGHIKPGNLDFKGQTKDDAKEKKKEEKLIDSVNLEEYFEKLYKGLIQPNSFSKQALLKVNLEKLQKNEFFRVLEYLEKDLPMLDDSKFYDLLGKHASDSYDKQSDSYRLSSSIFVNMSLEQMDKTLKKLPNLNKDENFVLQYFSKKFSRELSEKDNEYRTDEEKRESLVKIYEYVKTLPEKFSGLKGTILLEILHNGIKIDKYDENYFIEYLKAPRIQSFLRTPVIHGSEHSYLIRALAVSESTKLPVRGFLAKYLEFFFLKGAKMDKFEAYVHSDFLREIWEDTMLMAGKEVEMTPGNSSRLERLGTEVRIKILPSNKDCFKVGDDVRLKVEVKNVPTLFIKIFEINMENYYRKNMDYFKTDVNLDGLVASIEKTEESKDAPHIRSFKEFVFSELKGKVGLYVIELIGNGKSSRAIIKIGSLSLISHETSAGQICYILDGERKVCCHESTGIWMDNTYFKANIEKKGRIVVPYHPSSSSENTKAILLHQGMAQLVDFVRVDERYEFRCGFYLLPESVILGKTAKIIIRPHLTINKKTTSLSLLKNIKCTLNTANFIDNIPATRTFNDLVLSDKGELIINFQVGPNIDNLSIMITAEVQNVSKNTKQTVSVHHDFCIANHKSEEAIGEFYLKLNDKKDYSISLLGKNGEAIKDASVELNYTTEMCQDNKQIHAETNAQGCINLGKMEGVTTIRARYAQTSRHNTEKCWKLPSESVMQYPEYVDIIEGEDVEFPITLEDSKQVYLFRSRYNGANIENLNKLVKVGKQGKELYCMVSIKGLKEGEYLLSGFGNDSIKIQVHKGVYWKENERFILKDNSLLENADKQGFVKIKSVEFEEVKEGKARMHIEVNGATKDKCRVHVLLFKYLPENLDALTLRMLAKDEYITSEHHFERWNNLYLPERELGTELRYCFDRRNESRFVGNTLEKPRLVLRRNFLRNTHAKEEEVTAGTAYQRKEEERSKHRDQIKHKKMARHGGAAHYKEAAAYGYRGRAAIATPNEDRIATYQNFLATEPLVKTNCLGNAEGKLTVEVDEKFKEDYGCVLVLAVDKGSVAHYLLPLPGTNYQKRDISLAVPLSAEKSYSEVRSTKALKRLETYTIEDIASTNIQLIDSLEKVSLINRILLRLDGRTIEHLDNFEKLLKWETMSEEEKNKMTSRYGSHELNLFLYKKDPEYFKKVIRPYLVNKMEKTFTDYYLLEDSEAALKYATTQELYAKMHYLERALLVERLVLGGKVELAKTIAQRMKDWFLQFPKDLAKQNRLFTAVLSLGELVPDKAGNFFYQHIDIEAEQPRAASYMRQPAPQAFAKMSAPMSANRMMLCADAAPMAHDMRYDEVDMKMEEECAMNDEEADEMEEEREQQKPSLEELGETKEYCETNYYWYPGAFTDASFIKRSEFWVDYAMNCVEGKNPFLSANFIYSHENLTDIMAGYSLLDLPFTSGDHGYRTTEGRGAEYKVASNVIVFQKEVKESKENISNNILVAQKFINPDDRENEEKIEEFLVNRVYEGQVVITNISSKKLDFDLLLQIPQGSLPLGTSPYQKSYSITLERYKTVVKPVTFYFPTAGKFQHSPASVSIESVVVAKSPAEILNVVTEKTKISQENYREVVSTGNYDLILKFLREKPIEGIKEYYSTNITWLYKDPKFFNPFVDLMKEQHRFESTLWSYSFYHKEREELMNEYLNSRDDLKRTCGYYFESKLFSVRPIDVGVRHLDYYPLVNPRAHKNLANTPDNSQPMILNEEFYSTYKTFILYLIEKPNWDLADNMNLIYYLLLQDRTSEAIKKFEKITEQPVGILKLQYDYMAAYLDFYTGGPEFKKARKIVAEYLNYPVLSWRLLFADIDQQLKEYDGAVIEEKLDVEEEERKERAQKKLLTREAQLEISLENKETVIIYNDISSVTIKYYIIDLEILFSRTPFLTQSTEDFSYVQPNSLELVNLDPKGREHRVKIPEKYSTKNVVIEVNGAGIQKLATHFSTTMKVQAFENYGELKVTDEAGKPISKVYVKAFTKKKSGETGFYKDGYTDIRGRFDYVSLNASELAKVERFALFIMSDEHGSLIRECSPPTTTIRPEPGVEPIKPRLANYYK